MPFSNSPRVGFVKDRPLTNPRLRRFSPGTFLFFILYFLSLFCPIFAQVEPYFSIAIDRYS